MVDRVDGSVEAGREVTLIHSTALLGLQLASIDTVAHAIGRVSLWEVCAAEPGVGTAGSLPHLSRGQGEGFMVICAHRQAGRP